MENNALPQTWNTFRHRDQADLRCAVPADAAVPRFLFSGAWDFSGQHPEMHPLSGYGNTIARQSVLMNGFYLFQLVASDARGDMTSERRLPR